MLSFAFVSTGVGDGLEEDMPARSMISSTYFFCERNRLPECRVTEMPRK